MPSDVRAPQTCLVRMSLLLEPRLHRIDQAYDWGRAVVDYAEVIDPGLLRVRGFSVDGLTIWVDLIGFDSAARMQRILEDHDGMRRFRTRVADLDLSLTVIVDEENAS